MLVEKIEMMVSSVGVGGRCIVLCCVFKNKSD